MKKSMNFHAPMWLLVLGLAFGLWGCNHINSDDTDEVYGYRPSPFHITAVNRQFQNILTSKESPYDLDYVHIIMHDGKRVDDLKYSHGTDITSTDLPFHPAYRGYVFESDFLGTIINYKISNTPYDSKPFYLYWSPEEVDTLVWKGETRTLYCNGDSCYIAEGSPYMIKKGNN